MGGLSLPETFDSHFLRLRLGPTARNTLQEFIDIDVSTEDLVRILDQNPAFRAIFYRFVNKKLPAATSLEQTKSENASHGTTHRLISLLGMIGSRNLILAIRMARCVDHRFPINEKGDVDVQATELLKNSLALEDLFQRKKLPYPETAFALGCYYDWFMYGQKSNHQMKTLETSCKEILKRAHRNAMIAYTLASQVKDISPKFAMAGGFLLQMGKIHMAFRYHHPGSKNFVDFDKRNNEKPFYTQTARVRMEKSLFGVTHEEMASYSLFFYDTFKPIWQPILHYRTPYLLKGSDPVLYKLAVLLSLAESMTRNWTIPTDENSAIFEAWRNPWVKDLKLTKSQMIQAIKDATKNI